MKLIKILNETKSIEQANIEKLRADAQKLSATQKGLSQSKKNTSDKLSKARLSKQSADIASKKADLSLTIAQKSQQLKNKSKITEIKHVKYRIGQIVYLTQDLFGHTFKMGTSAKIIAYADMFDYDYWIRLFPKSNTTAYAVRETEISDIKPKIAEARIKIKELVPVDEFMKYEPDSDYVEKLVMIGKNMSDAYKTRNAIGAIEVAMKELRKEKYAQIDEEIKLAKPLAIRRLADYWTKEDKSAQ